MHRASGSLGGNCGFGSGKQLAQSAKVQRSCSINLRTQQLFVVENIKD
jgi:hypothetical protein